MRCCLLIDRQGGYEASAGEAGVGKYMKGDMDGNVMLKENEGVI